MPALIERDQELADMVGIDLTDIRNSVFRTEPDEGVEFLAIEFDGPGSQITGTAGVKVDPNPLSEIVRLVNLKVGRFD